MSRYSKISRRMWVDDGFRKLSAAKPNAQTLWMYLLTGPHNTAIPGLFVLGEATMAESLGWPLEASRRCFAEIVDGGMAHADRATRLVWLPKALEHNSPESANVVVGWRGSWDLLPECALRDAARRAVETTLAARGNGFSEAFRITVGEAPAKVSSNPAGYPSAKRSAKLAPKPSVKAATEGFGQGFTEPSSNQEQEQEQEEEPPTPLPGVAAIAVQKSTPTTRVFDHWRSAMGSPRSVLDKKRRKRIDWAIETYDEATCIQAIDGCRADPFSMGENDRGTKFNALELIFRDAEHVEKFREIGKAANAPPARDVDDLPPLVDPSKLPTPEQLRANLAALDEIRRSSPFAAKEAQSA